MFVSEYKNIFHRIPRKPLFHYTSYKGLLGIVTDKKIRATYYPFLNDSTEYQHGIRLGKKYLKKFIERTSRKFHSTLSYSEMKSIEERWNYIENVPVFVCSFTEKDDLLSQWRGYCNDGGVCLGFDFSKLGKSILRQGFYLNKCIYNEKAKEMEMKRLWDKSIKGTSREGKSKNNWLVLVALNFIGECMQVSPIFKDESFSEEKEWRLISYSYRFNIHDSRIKFREGKCPILIPYVEFELTENDKPFSFSKVIIGPTSENKELSKSSILSFFLTKGVVCEYKNIVYSNIPYKNV